jgi:hypothetical protein
MRRGATAADAAALLAVLCAAAATHAQFGGADVPPDVAIRWSQLDPKKWNVRGGTRTRAPLIRTCSGPI